MGMERVNRIIESLKNHSYQPKPAKRQYIRKKNGKLRPLGVPSFDDKLVQEVARMILESIYEPNFSSLSHGFRPGRSCHTALMHVQRNFTGVKWFIEGDIKGFFDNIDHQTMVGILRKRIKDEYFLGLIWKFLKAGYLEDWKFHNTYSGTPQGSIISPILSNIYLNEFDKYVEKYTEKFNNGKVRAENSEYKKIMSRIGRLKHGRYSEENWEQFSDEEKANAKLHLKELYGELYQLNRLSEAFLAKQKELSAIEQEMKQYVHKVMDDREMWDSLEDVAEMISYLPQNYLRFTLYERLYSLQSTIEADSGQDAHTMKLQ